MATAMLSAIDQIGETAGQIWHLLSDRGKMSLTQLVKEIDAPRDQVMQAIGWLAREEKLDLEEKARGKVVSLR